MAGVKILCVYEGGSSRLQGDFNRIISLLEDDDVVAIASRAEEDDKNLHTKIEMLPAQKNQQ